MDEEKLKTICTSLIDNTAQAPGVIFENMISSIIRSGNSVSTNLILEKKIFLSCIEDIINSRIQYFIEHFGITTD